MAKSIIIFDGASWLNFLKVETAHEAWQAGFQNKQRLGAPQKATNFCVDFAQHDLLNSRPRCMTERKPITERDDIKKAHLKDR